jgi:TatA/E family protein of Tat protein translocase
MGISITELIIIFIVLLILFGPEQLPVIARQFGKIMGELKKGSDAVRREFYNSVYTPADEVTRDLIADTRSLKALKAEILAPPAGATPSVDRRRDATPTGAAASPENDMPSEELSREPAPTGDSK